MEHTNANNRLEIFCDGVFAIALTLLIVDVRLPESIGIHTTPELWRALGHLTPSVLAFLLSFGIVLITWVNHHGTLRLIRGSSASFIYANGFLLLTVVFIPFPTSLLGSYVWTDHAAPAVVLYDGVLAMQAIGWLLITHTALRNDLVHNEAAAAVVRARRRNAYMAFALYGLLAVAALWFPVTVALVTTGTWIFWLALSIRLREV